MKTLMLFSLLLVCGNLLAQSSFRIKVVDASSEENIEKAIVYIEEIPLPDKETDINGFVYYENIPEDRKVRVNIRKQGYMPKQVEVVGNIDIGPDNNITIKLEKETKSASMVIWGEVINKDGDDMEGAMVEVNIIGKVYRTQTDEGGNYQFRISSDSLQGVSSFRIEASHAGCEKYRSDETVPKAEIFNKDIILSCSGNNVIATKESDDPSSPSTLPKVENDQWIYELIGCKKSGNQITCTFNITSKGQDRSLEIFGKNYSQGSRMYDNASNEFGATDIRIGNQNGKFVERLMISDLPINSALQFDNISSQATKIALLEIGVRVDRGKFEKISFRDIEIQ